VKGLASIALELTFIEASDGQLVRFATDSSPRWGPESKGSDAAKIGGGAPRRNHRSVAGVEGSAIGPARRAEPAQWWGPAGKPAVLARETEDQFRSSFGTLTERR